jgi:hypothetical protein
MAGLKRYRTRAVRSSDLGIDRLLDFHSQCRLFVPQFLSSLSEIQLLLPERGDL